MQSQIDWIHQNKDKMSQYGIRSSLGERPLCMSYQVQIQTMTEIKALIVAGNMKNLTEYINNHDTYCTGREIDGWLTDKQYLFFHTAWENT